MSADAVESNFWVAAGTIALAVTTGVLAFITFLYMRQTKKMATETEKLATETEKMRIAAQMPNFALEPSQFRFDVNNASPSEFGRLNLVNHGRTATDIRAIVGWYDNADSSGSSREFYILSLGENSYARLDIPVKDISVKSLFIKVDITCKDVTGKDYKTTITNGLDKIRGTGIRLTYQNNYLMALYNALEDIHSKLSDIRSKI